MRHRITGERPTIDDIFQEADGQVPFTLGVQPVDRTGRPYPLELVGCSHLLSTNVDTLRAEEDPNRIDGIFYDHPDWTDWVVIDPNPDTQE